MQRVNQKRFTSQFRTQLEKMELKFKDTTAAIIRLHQWFTYEGLLEGVPHDKLNERILQGVKARATSLTDIQNYCLIEPVQTPIDIGKPYPFGVPMSLPRIICVAGLRCSRTSNPNIGGISELTLICFQDSFSPPFEPEILNKNALITEMNNRGSN